MATMHMLYGLPIRDAIQKGNLDEMKEMLSVSAWMIRNSGDDTESDEFQDWKSAHQDLAEAVAEKTNILIDPSDILVIKDGIVVIDSISLARSLKQLTSSDEEGFYIELKVGWK